MMDVSTVCCRAVVSATATTQKIVSASMTSQRTNPRERINLVLDIMIVVVALGAQPPRRWHFRCNPNRSTNTSHYHWINDSSFSIVAVSGSTRHRTQSLPR